MAQQEFLPPSLAWYFEAPDGYRGEFGWLCGYSADPGFMNDAVERFTRCNKGQRAHAGQIRLALMLDPGNPQINPIDVPGVAHLPLGRVEKPFRLLHAKVAVLGYRSETVADNWLVRLIVSTGNWTVGSLEQSLDLVWSIETSSEQAPATDEEAQQVRADMTAAWNLLAWLRSCFDTRLLTAVPTDRYETDTLVALQRLDQWMQAVGQKTKGIEPRFFDNRFRSLLGQLTPLVSRVASVTRRNYIGMGSGFFESAGISGKIPSVLQKIVETLQQGQLLTNHPEIDVFVNPDGCQAVAESTDALNDEGWNVRCAGKPGYFGEAKRSLHAKFIFSGNCRKKSSAYSSAWLYLGSGNLTNAGFVEPMSANGGNLEAGVVFVPGVLYRELSKNINPEQYIGNRLPVQRNRVVSDKKPPQTGSDMQERETAYVAPPVVGFTWTGDGDEGWLKPLVDVENLEFDLLNGEQKPCPFAVTKGFRWVGGCPRQVQVRWLMSGEIQQATVAVVDEFGRVAAAALPQIDVEEAWWQLAEFPVPPEDTDPEAPGDGGDRAPPSSDPDISPASARGASYPVRQIMELIENIADKQTRLSRADWIAWCTRLEQCLVQASQAAALELIKSMELNPISPLWSAPFRPDFAEDESTAEGRRYEKVLRRIEETWGVAELADIGEAS